MKDFDGTEFSDDVLVLTRPRALAKHRRMKHSPVANFLSTLLT